MLPVAPQIDPYRITEDTWILPELFTAGPDALISVNSMLVTGSEPTVVDTGGALNRDRWLRQAWSIVDPGDVRWIFISHDDHDHVGNLLEVLDACPQATLMANWWIVERSRRHARRHGRRRVGVGGTTRAPGVRPGAPSIPSTQAERQRSKGGLRGRRNRCATKHSKGSF